MPTRGSSRNNEWESDKMGNRDENVHGKVREREVLRIRRERNAKELEKIDRKRHENKD